MSWWSADRKLYALNFLLNAGLSPYGAAGLVSRWANVEAPNGPASRGGYLNRAWGIAQWLGPRLISIDGNPDLNDQLGYVIQELSGSEGRAGALLRSASNIDEGARAATAYERASGWNVHTNTDNFTGRTAAGMPDILSLLSGYADIAPSAPSGNVFSDSNGIIEIPSNPLLSLILVGLGVLIFAQLLDSY